MDHHEQHVHLTIHFADIQLLLSAVTHMEKRIMGSVQDVKDAIAAERAEVQAKLAALVQSIDDLKAQIAAGTGITAADMDELKTEVQAISEPEASTTPSTPPAS